MFVFRRNLLNLLNRTLRKLSIKVVRDDYLDMPAMLRRPFLSELGVERLDENLLIHESIARNETGLSKKQVMSWFEEIRSRNRIYKVYDDEILRLILEREYFRIFTKSLVSHTERLYRFEWISKLLKKMPLGLKIKIARMIVM